MPGARLGCMPLKRGVIRMRHGADDGLAPSVLPEVAQRAARESSAEDWLTRARAFRLAVVDVARQVPGNPDYPFLASRPGAPDGTLTNWNWFVGDDFDSAMLPAVLDAMQADSPLLDLQAASALQAAERLGQPARWLERTGPLIVRAGKQGRLRVGVFNWTTDRDAFIRELLGEPVPARPRYQPIGPSLKLGFAEDLWSAQEESGFRPGDATELYGASRDEAVADVERLIPVVRRLSDSEPGAGQLAEAALRADPGAWVASPLGRLLLPLARGAPGWRSPRVSAEWAAAFDLGVVGVHGLALWAPGAYELRQYRRGMAAHLRYLFDHHVSAWNRFPDERRRREALLVYWRRLEPVMDSAAPTIAHICTVVRRKWPAAYEGEPREVTLRRLYRVSRQLAAASRR